MKPFESSRSQIMILGLKTCNKPLEEAENVPDMSPKPKCLNIPLSQKGTNVLVRSNVIEQLR